MERKARWLEKYPDAHCWAFGDSPALADELAALVIAGKKRGTCGSLASFQAEARAVKPGDCLLYTSDAADDCSIV